MDTSQQNQKIDYYEYIRSNEWYARTDSVRKRNNGVCEVCDMRYAEAVHHRTYENLGNEKIEDLLSVCDCCHKMIHELGDFFIWPSKIGFLKELQNEQKQLSMEEMA